MNYTVLPAVNASLNGTSAVLLLIGHRLIHSKRVAAHRRFMIAAFTVSSLFLVSYIYYHAHARVVHFLGTGWIRPVYFSILVSHTILAICVVPLVLVTLTRGLRGNFERHRAVARWTYPIWLYVSITGVIVYVLLFRLYPHS